MKTLHISNKADSGKSYAELIVSGRKTWEIRKHNTRFRGRFGVIDATPRLLGTVELYKVLGPFAAKEISAKKEHCSNFSRLKKYSKGKRCLYAWILRNPKKYARPKKVKVQFKNQFDWIETN